MREANQRHAKEYALTFIISNGVEHTVDAGNDYKAAMMLFFRLATSKRYDAVALLETDVEGTFVNEVQGWRSPHSYA